MSKYLKFNDRGVILIESILALAVIVMILTALVTALVSAVSSSNFSRDQSIATGYAQEGLEIARSEKEINYNNFRVLNNTYCLNEDAYEIDTPAGGGCVKNIEGKFTRTVYINPSGRDGRVSGSPQKCGTGVTPGESILVVSTVTWTDGKCSSDAECHKIELDSCFVNLNRISAP